MLPNCGNILLGLVTVSGDGYSYAHICMCLLQDVGSTGACVAVYSGELHMEGFQFGGPLFKFFLFCLTYPDGLGYHQSYF